MSAFELSKEDLAAEIARIAKREAESEVDASQKVMRLTLADREAGRAEAIVAEARKRGAVLFIERAETDAGRAIRAYAEDPANSRDAIQARERAAARRT